MTSRQSTVAVVLVALLVAGAAPIPAASAGEYAVTTETSIDTPNRTVTVEGDDYRVTSVGRVTFGDTFDAAVSAPAGETVTVYLYDGDRRILDSEEVTGNGSVSFETSYYEPGTYVLALYDGSDDVRTIQPVVFAGYETSLDAPTVTDAGDNLTATVSLRDSGAISDPHGVELVVARDGETVARPTAEQISDGAYEASFGAELDVDEYTVYAVVQNDSTANGRRELIGISDRRRFTVESASDEGENGGQSGGTAGGSNTADDGSTDSGADSPASTSTETEEGTVTATDSETPTLDAESESNGSPTGAEETSAPPTDDVITPVPSASETTATDAPGFFLLVAVVAWAGLAALLGRRTRR